LLFFMDGDSAEDRLGFSVAGVGDVNGDRVPDLAVGAPGDDNQGLQAGSVRVFSGATGAILYTFHGDGAGDQLGFSVGAAGDANGDGRADIVAGADEDGTNGSKAGLARVFSGLDGFVLHTLFGDAANDRFGRSVARPTGSRQHLQRAQDLGQQPAIDLGRDPHDRTAERNLDEPGGRG
jgi:hypothetical protein